MPKGERIRLLVVASGPTEWDEAGRLQGSTDLPLCEAGQAAVQEDAASLEVPKLSQVFCAPDEASRTTAAILAKESGAKVKMLQGLAEMDLGLWEGLRASDLEERYPRAARQWVEDPAGVNVPEGAPFAEGQDRIIATLAKSLEKLKSGSSVAVVLRPLGLGIVRCWLRDQPTTALWSEVRDRPHAEWYEVSGETLHRLPVSTATR